MHARYFTAVLLASAASVLASPHPAPTPTMTLAARQESDEPTAGDVVGDAIDGAGSVATSVFGDATSVATSVFGDATSVAGSVGSDIASGASEVFTTVTSVGGEAFTVVSRAGEDAITLATDGAGIATSTLGGWYTIVSDSASSAAADVEDEINGDNAASKSLLVGAASVVGSVLLGAFITL